MRFLKTFENFGETLNKSFNLTTKDVDNLIDGLRDEYEKKQHQNLLLKRVNNKRVNQ
jgi:hypothetical protein